MTDAEEDEKKILRKIKITSEELKKNIKQTADIQQNIEKHQIELEKEIKGVEKTDSKLQNLKKNIKNPKK